MSDYIAGIAIMLLGLSPMFVPAALVTMDAVGKFRERRRRPSEQLAVTASVETATPTHLPQPRTVAEMDERAA